MSEYFIILRSIPLSLYSSIMKSPMPYQLSDGKYIKYLGKSDTAKHEADDVFVLLPSRSSLILAKIRFIGGIDSCNDYRNTEVKTPATEWE